MKGQMRRDEKADEDGRKEKGEKSKRTEEKGQK